MQNREKPSLGITIQTLQAAFTNSLRHTKRRLKTCLKKDR